MCFLSRPASQAAGSSHPLLSDRPLEFRADEYCRGERINISVGVSAEVEVPPEVKELEKKPTGESLNLDELLLFFLLHVPSFSFVPD